MFNVDEVVSYGPNGIYRITEIAEKNLTGKIAEYYVMKSVKGNSTVIYVPVDNKTLVEKMRPVLSADEVFKLIAEMPDEELVWNDDDTERKAEFKAIISESKPEKLAQLIKTVFLHKSEIERQGKKLHIADERAFKEAERILYDEFSIVLDVNASSIPEFIQNKIDNEGEK